MELLKVLRIQWYNDALLSTAVSTKKSVYGHKSHIGQKNVSHQNIEKNAYILF